MPENPAQQIDLAFETLRTTRNARRRRRALEEIDAAGNASPAASTAVHRRAVEEMARMSDDVAGLIARHRELEQIIETMSSHPWIPAVLLGTEQTRVGPRAHVSIGGERRLVRVVPEVDTACLVPGAAVYVSHERNLLMDRASDDFVRSGETAVFDRLSEDGRLVVTSHHEEFLADAASGLEIGTLAVGDRVRWSREAGVAFERVACAPSDRFLVDRVADLGADAIGGRDDALDEVAWTLSAALLHPERAAAYGAKSTASVLLQGPPGCGKTLIARITAATLQRESGRPTYFSVLKPAELESPFVGETQANIREAFAAMNAKARDGIVVLVLDEVEAWGRIRGAAGAHHSDKALNALLAELDGFEKRKFAVISTTNRKELVDPALLERLEAVEIQVPRPDREAARAIFGVHLPEDFPYGSDDATSSDSRGRLIDQAVSILYAPNADNQIATLGLRNGTKRSVHARELVSGRLIQQICENAGRRALRRELSGQGGGLCADDMDAALQATLDRLRRTLRATNADAWLPDIASPADVASVTPFQPRVSSAHGQASRA